MPDSVKSSPALSLTVTPLRLSESLSQSTTGTVEILKLSRWEPDGVGRVHPSLDPRRMAAIHAPAAGEFVRAIKS